MHHHVAECDNRHILKIRDMLKRTAMNIIHCPLMQHEPDPRAPGESFIEPFDLRFQHLLSGGKGRHQNREAIGHAAQMRVIAIRTRQIVRRQPVFALRRTGSCKRDQFRQIAVSFAVLREQNQPKRGRTICIAQLKVRANDKRQTHFFRCDVCAHNPG